MFKLPLQQKRRHILHVDADAFFASVEQILNPNLKGKPVLVGGPSDTRGIVSAASYEARVYGIKSAMPMYLAKKKCPHAVVISGNFKAYREYSKRMYNVFSSYTPDIQMASIDEAYLDISGCGEIWGESAETLARSMLLELYQKVGLSVSCGMASSKCVAKVASSINKPHKFTLVPFGKEREFLAPLELRAMPGIGPRTAAALESCGIKTLGNFADIGMQEVVDKFGIQALKLWKRCRGIDNSPVQSSRPLPKSISKEHTFYENVQLKNVCLAKIKELSVLVFQKLRRYEMKASTVFLKIRYKNLEQGTKGAKYRDQSFQKHLSVPNCSDSKLFAVAKELFLKNVQDDPIRLIGIGVSSLKRNYNLGLFEREEKEDLLFEAVDRMREKYGEESLQYGSY